MGSHIRSPKALLSSKSAVAQTLSVSNEHATLLLRTKSPSSSSEDEVKSLLKLNVVPCHKSDLTPTNNVRGLSVDELEQAIDPSDSTRILTFLADFTFQLTSESGAEYSYYTATRTTWWRKNPFLTVKKMFQPKTSTKESFKVELISPASDRQIQRSLPTPRMCLVEETPELYSSVIQPYVQSIVEGGSLSWIRNVVEGKKEVERLLLNMDDFVLNVDTKWRSHPDALTVPRQEWYNHTSVQDLYCLAIIKETGIASLRDLTSRHLPMLRSILEECPKAIETTYGVPRDQLRIFVHYHPQFYHFHVHFTRLENEIGAQVERGHLLSDIIQNLELDPDYYANRIICYKLKTSDKLFGLIQKSKEKK
jgi:m7GpppX diphosphatase